MSAILLIGAGVCMAITMFALMARISMLRFLGYASLIDVIFTIIIFWLFAHTFSGVVAGSVAGLCMAIGLTVMRKCLGYERLKRVGWKIKWVYVAPTWKMSQFSYNKDTVNV